LHQTAKQTDLFKVLTKHGKDACVQRYMCHCLIHEMVIVKHDS